MKTLDKTKPWFSVHGDASGAAFEQDGCLFGLDGEEIAAVESAVISDPPAGQQPAIVSADEAEAKAGSDEKPAAAEAPEKKTPGRKKQPAAEAPASAIDEQIAAQAGV